MSYQQRYDPEREPLDNPYSQYNNGYSPSPAPYRPPAGGYRQPSPNHREQYQQPEHGDHDPYGVPQQQPSSSRGPQGRYGPGSHPDSQYSREYQQQHTTPQDYYSQIPPSRNEYRDDPGLQQPPPLPRGTNPRYRQAGYGGANVDPNVTPGADNFSDAASGGMAGIAYSVAEKNARESGMDATNQQGGQRYGGEPEGSVMGGDPYGNPNYQPPQQRGGFDQYGYDNNNLHATPNENPFAGGSSYGGSSHSSMQGSGHPNIGPGPGGRFSDDPYQGYSAAKDPGYGMVNPHDIVDDGDDGLVYKKPARTSMLSLHSNRSGRNLAGASAAGVGAVAAGAAGGAAAMGVVRNSTGIQYDALHNAATSSPGSGAMAGSGSAAQADTTATTSAVLANKESEWLKSQNSGNKKWKWAIIIGVIVIILLAVGGGVAGGIIIKNKKSGAAAGGGGGQTADEDSATNGDLNIKSKDIQALLNNKDLHKVFPGMDYTPLNTQYPDCLKWPPSQNNITRDVAVLTQLTNTIRLYGTDCNQTQMVIHAIDKLDMKDTVKIWMGVWQDNNATTNARQLSQMWEILDQYGSEPFAGIIVANEILFRQQMTATQLSTLLSSVRTNLTAKGITLPVATSDLGDALTQEIATASDYVMANIHPFFAGVNAKDAADWTYSFWENRDGPLWKSDKSKNVIAEVGWPSSGGTNCGSSTVTSCPDGSVAGIDEMNSLLDGWVCEALNNGTHYFWFEAFDEPWKIRFNEAGKEWEDQWGLLTVNRKLKDGVKIPDCGGQTVDGKF